MKITIGGEEQRIKSGTLEIENAIDERSTASFVVLDPDGDKTFRKGQPVYIVNEHHKTIFGGVVENAYAKRVSRQNYFMHEIQCVDWHYLADKRIIARAYSNESVLNIVKDIVDGYLGDEGIQYIEAGDETVFLQPSFPIEIAIDSSIDDFGSLEEAIFNYVPASRALSDLKEQANAWWRIEPNRNLYFVKREHLVYGDTVDSSYMLNDTVSVEHGNPKYRNRQWVRGGEDLTDEQIEVQKGDGEKQDFGLGFRIGRVPTIEISTDGGLTWQSQTVGIKGLEDDRQWYWSKYDETITQDRDETVLTNTDKVRVAYQGIIDIIIRTDDKDAILDRQTVEEIGTGYVEHVIDETTLESRAAAFQLGSNKIKKYAVIGKTLEFTTQTDNFEPGHLITVDLPEHGINNDEMLIESVVAYNPPNSNLMFYRIRAVEGPTQGSWQKFFGDIAAIGETFVVRVNIGEDEVLVLLFEYEKDWDGVAQPDNIMYEVYPASDLYPSASLYPMFAYSDRIKYLEWKVDGSIAGRKAVTIQSGQDTDSMETTFYLNPPEAVGTVEEFHWYGGINATAALGTGVRVVTDGESVATGETLPMEKTDAEAWEVKRTDYK